jgi:hypothetical protein
MADLMKPNPNRRSTSHGVGHDGSPRARVPVTPGMIHNVDRNHEAKQDQRKGNLALQGKPKAHQNVSLHGGMTERQQRAGHGAGGLGHATSPAVNDEPLDLTPKTPGKTFTPPKPSPGMRSR